MSSDSKTFEVVANDGSKLVVSGIELKELQSALEDEISDGGEKLARFGMLCGGGCSASGAVCGANCELS